MHIFSYNKKFHKIQNSLQASVPFIESLWDFTQKKRAVGRPAEPYDSFQPH